MLKLGSAAAFVLLLGDLAIADGMPVAHYRYHRHYRLPERHVIEVVAPPYSGNFIINGTRFTAKTAACLPWAAGEPITLRAGDWHGRCVDAVFYNVLRRRSCEMWCQ